MTISRLFLRTDCAHEGILTHALVLPLLGPALVCHAANSGLVVDQGLAQQAAGALLEPQLVVVAMEEEEEEEEEDEKEEEEEEEDPAGVPRSPEEAPDRGHLAVVPAQVPVTASQKGEGSSHQQRQSKGHRDLALHPRNVDKKPRRAYPPR